ncbi:MAG: hypothetical protein LBG77_08715 [Dysgonamonadaceae bacterium]|jgi:hypothetical protein|nr:hypothetical protein [Dysgonamonadaceae bacterium]
MKARYFLLATTGLLFATQLLAAPTSFQERSESWLRSTNDTAVTGPGAGRTNGEDATPDPSVPVGEACWLLTVLAGAYSIYKSKNNKFNLNIQK